jgi:hypothetical protein
MLALGSLIVLLGCAKEPSVVGQWTGEIFSEPVAIEFKPDNTASVSVKSGTMGATFAATYEITKTDLTLVFKKYTTQNVDASLASAAKTILDPIVGKTFKGTYHFNNDAELAVTYQGKTDILTRVKSAEP